MVRMLLMRLRKQFANERRYYWVSSVGLVLSMLAGIAADMFFPFDGLWNVVRAALLVPAALFGFAVAYGISLNLHRYQRRRDDEWVPYRFRFSLAWRRRIALIVGAVLIVLMYANGFRVGYTFMATVIVCMGVALLAFIRPTRDEQLMDELQIPDARDAEYQKYLNEARQKREAAQAEREKRKQARKRK